MYQKMIQTALTAGAAKAAVIPGEKIVTSEEFRRACESNVCGNYGRCWMCPPDVGDIRQLIEQVKSYPQALIYQSIYELEDSFDIEGMEKSSRLHAGLSRNIEQELSPILPPGYLHLICGGCRFCQVCAKAEGLPCRAPEQARASLESYGIDVYHTVEGTELKYINGPDTVTYFSMILFGGGNEGGNP